jgi:hypothetical protein
MQEARGVNTLGLHLINPGDFLLSHTVTRPSTIGSSTKSGKVIVTRIPPGRNTLTRFL